jgi:D-alanyl-D-alanine carboxypeptidase/D-alanyl-D-alanine-endopeptidase (penicillin-binding protein 4)
MLMTAVSHACGGGSAPSKGLDPQELGEALGRELKSKALRGADVGVVVYDLVAREMVFTHHPDLPLIVASNNKLVTTAAALERLGPDFQFRTTVAAAGRRTAEGTLRGNLLIIGRGDPSISGRFHKGRVTAVLERWAKALADAGIERVRGDVLADDSYFDGEFTHPGWPKRHAAWYCAQVCALSMNDSCVDLAVFPGEHRGDRARVAVQPPTSYVDLYNGCTTSRASGGSNHVIAHRLAGKNQLRVTGKIRRRSAPFETSVTVHDPALYTATVFKEVLERAGIEVTGLVRRRPPGYEVREEEFEEIITTTSSLADAVAVANGRSQNFYAEQILKTLGREMQGEGSWDAGAKAVKAWLRDAGIHGTVQYADGSGLARGNRFTARQLAAVLAWMNCRRTSTLYWRSLAQPGKPGTLARRSLLFPLQGRLFAKTGFIDRVSALSGYLECPSGRLLAFVTLVNNYRAGLSAARRAQDRMVLHMARYAPKMVEQ